MPTEDEVAQFSLVVSTDDPLHPDAAAVEEFGLALREALTDAGATRIDQPVGPAAPDGTRAVEVLGILTLVITAVQTGESLVKVVQAVQAVLRRVRARRARVHVRAGDANVEIGADSAVQPIVDRLLAVAGTGAVRARSALVVANSRYDDPFLAQLRGPAKDADALARVLGDPAIGGFDVDLLLDADETAIRRRVARFFADRDRDDVLLLYFSCHGLKDQRGDLYLAARDTELSSVSATAVAAAFVNGQIAQTQSRRVVLVLDCCYSGAFARGGSAVRGDGAIHVGEEFSTGTGRVVLTASSATEYAFEGTELTQSQARPSVFTTALVEGLLTGDADLGGDGQISVDELYDYTYRQVRRQTPDQTPMKWTFGVEGSVVLARSAKAPALPADVAADLASDRPALRVEAVHALARLRTDDNPAMRERATAELQRLSSGDDSDRVRTAARQALGEAAIPAVAPAAPAPAPASAAPAPVAAAPVVPASAPVIPASAPVAAPPAARASAEAVAAAAAVPRQTPPPRASDHEAASEPVSRPAVSRQPEFSAPPRPLTWSHPVLLAIAAGITVVTGIQLLQILLLPYSVTTYTGVNAVVAALPAAVIGAVQMRRVGQARWMALVIVAAVLTVLQWLSTAGNQRGLGDNGAGVFTFADNGGDAVAGLIMRWLVIVPAIAWYAAAGPAARPHIPMTFARLGRPGLLAAALGAAVVSLTGALLMFHHVDRVEFAVATAPIGRSGFGTALLGLGNLYDPYGVAGTSWGTLLWTVGWLILVALAIGVVVAAWRSRRRRWAALSAVFLIASVVTAFALQGQHLGDEVELLAQYLAVVALLAAIGPIAYAFLHREEQGQREGASLGE